MTSSAKRSSLILFSAALLLTMAIAAGLDALAFSPGMPFPEAEARACLEAIEGYSKEGRARP